MLSRKFIKKKCFVCGEIFDAKNEEQLLCSIDCSKQFKLRRSYKDCHSCGTTKNNSDKYCQSCRGITRNISKLRFEILKRYNFTCQYCGRKVKDVIKLNVDHIIPYSMGGLSTPSNLITSCFDCNIGKSNNLLENKMK